MLIQLIISDIGRALSTVQESFTTREWSIVIWIGIFIIFQMRRSSFQTSLLQVIKSLCNKNILILLLICYIYILGFVFVLYRQGIIHSFLLKDLLFWCILVPIPSMVGYISGKKTDFINFAICNGTIVSLFLAMQSYFTFSFVIEFVSFPILCVAAAVSAYAQTYKDKYETVYKFANNLIFTIGYVTLFVSLFKTITSTETLIEDHFFQSFWFNEILYLVFTPLLYLFCVLSAYQEWFNMLKSRSSKDNYQKRCSFFIKKCGLNLSKIRYISKHLHVYVPQTEEQLNFDFSECNKKYHTKYE